MSTNTFRHEEEEVQVASLQLGPSIVLDVQPVLKDLIE